MSATHLGKKYPEALGVDHERTVEQFSTEHITGKKKGLEQDTSSSDMEGKKGESTNRSKGAY